MTPNLPISITVRAQSSGSHLQGIAIDEKREFLYCSFTTCLLKCDLNGNVVGSVKGIVGHLGCIAYHSADGKVYGSLEYKNDVIGRGIARNIGYTGEIRDGFYAVRFDVTKIDRMDMDAERDGIMEAVYLREVTEDYTADGHRYGCSGIDGITFAPKIGESVGKNYLYVAYGVYGDTSREDNDHQVILCYDITGWDNYASPLNQTNMHRCGPESPDSKFFVFTGNTTYGIQNLEYDSYTRTMIAAVYCGKKEAFQNYPMFFIDCAEKPRKQILRGIGDAGEVLSLTDLRSVRNYGELCGSRFPHGSTGTVSLGGGYFYFAKAFRDEKGFGGNIVLYRLDKENLTFVEAE